MPACLSVSLRLPVFTHIPMLALRTESIGSVMTWRPFDNTDLSIRSVIVSDVMVQISTKSARRYDKALFDDSAVEKLILFWKQRLA